MTRPPAHSLAKLCAVKGCENPRPPHGFVCAGCERQLRNDLRQVPDLAIALSEARARQVRMTEPSGGGGSAEKPLPLDLKAGDLLADLVRTLREHADPAARARGLYRPLDTAAALAGFLTSQVGWLAGRPVGAQVVQDVARIVVAGRRHIDRPAATWYGGPCGGLYIDDNWVPVECDAEMYFPVGVAVFQCRRCLQKHDVKERQAWVQKLAEDQLVHAGLAARALSILGEYVTSAQIRGWAHRGRLMEKGRDLLHPDRPLYRLGDIIDLATEAVDQRAKRGRAG